MYLFILPGFVYFVVFRYVPLLGNVIAWQDYSPFLGVRGSPWIAWDNFARLLTDPEVANAVQNTLVISVLQIVFAFPAPILLALLLNSLVSERIKRVVQSIVYLPHFIGWVIVISIWQALFGGTGLVSEILTRTSDAPVNLMTNPDTFAMLITVRNRCATNRCAGRSTTSSVRRSRSWPRGRGTGSGSMPGFDSSHWGWRATPPDARPPPSSAGSRPTSCVPLRQRTPRRNCAWCTACTARVPTAAQVTYRRSDAGWTLARLHDLSIPDGLEA